uniref:RING-type domain-containing protein n=1 Tax=Glossina brevipalpis TaxID=37001 RepID=A0A1A9WQQ5_9MUSC
MGDDIILCKIAKEHCTNVEEKDLIRYIKYKERFWQLIDALQSDARELQEILDILSTISLKSVEFCLVESWLVVIYHEGSQRNRAANETIERLFSIIFVNYSSLEGGINGRLNESTSGSEKVLKTYITTQLFEALKNAHLSLEINNQKTLKLPAKFLPTLCKYQERTVRWLLQREEQVHNFPAYFIKLQAKDSESIVYRYLCRQFFQREKPADISLPPGGILAEEMGLGKTVEILALILLHPRIKVKMPNFTKSIIEESPAKRRRLTMPKKVFCICTSSSKQDVMQCPECCLWQHKNCVSKFEENNDDIETPYFCPACWQQLIQDKGKIPSRATFIVSPNMINLQWMEEIKRHVQPALKVFIYEGVSAGKWICPLQLANYDIVLTHYNILRSDIYFTQDNVSERVMRNEPRSMRMHTPLLMLEWWRVCLDEAQMVESNISKAATLAKMLPSINRWAVTGTPIQRSLNDLQNLLQFIGFEEAAEAQFWDYVVNDFLVNYKPISCNERPFLLVNVLQKCMWRTSKIDIMEELKIPPQQEVTHRIEFNNLEKLFYREQHQECLEKFMENVHKYKRRMIVISPQIMKIILQPFLKIRQSCIMPVVVSNNIAQQKQFLQPQELHNYLKSNNELSCKSELRSMASSHNGLAALHFLEKRYDEALKHYKEVLKLAKNYVELNITVDKLLQIHALHNIMQILIILQPFEDKLPEETLVEYEQEYNALEWKYLETYSNTLSQVNTAYCSILEQINEDIAKEYLPFLGDQLALLSTGEVTSFLQKIFEECSLRFRETHAELKLGEIQSTRTVLFLIDIWFTKVSTSWKNLVKEFDSLQYFRDNVKSRNQVSSATWRDITQLVNDVYDCHLSDIRENEKQKKAGKSSAKKAKCKLCNIRDAINIFECLLFFKVIDEQNQLTDGVDNPSFEFFLNKVIFNYLKSKLKQPEIQASVEKILQYFDNLQTLCKSFIKLWIEMEYTIKAYDELNMCKMRISLAENAEEKSNFKIFKHEISQRIMEQQEQLFEAQRMFTMQLARLKYIKHLENKTDPGPCPICHFEEDDRYAVLECGHHLCYTCLKHLKQLSNLRSHFKCSICRHTQRFQNLYYASRISKKVPENDLEINGSYTSKITYIVRLVLKLKKQFEEAASQSKEDLKILIFSQWEPILVALAGALTNNNIKIRSQCTTKTIKEFKEPSLGITCLLMPLARGSKGLNLIEATHVFLIEPILNPGEELQAIGRIHRFGQTRSTTVHRFIVIGTIEENIYNFIASKQASDTNTTSAHKNWEFNNISLQAFESLFALEKKNESKSFLISHSRKMFGWKIDEYDIKLELAKCSNGTVYMARNAANGHVALKKFHLDASKEDAEQIRDEVLAMRFPEILIALIMRDVLAGVEYLHRRGYIHRSIRGSHILLNQTKAVLTGFRDCTSFLSHGGRVTALHQLPPHSVRSLNWLAPEVLEQNLIGYTEKSDIYSIGITCCELANGVEPFADSQPTFMFTEKIRGNNPTLLDRTTCPAVDEIIDIIATTNKNDSSIAVATQQIYLQRLFTDEFHQFTEICMEKKPSNRWPAFKLLSHTFFKQCRHTSILDVTQRYGMQITDYDQLRDNSLHINTKLNDIQIADNLDSTGTWSWEF